MTIVYRPKLEKIRRDRVAVARRMAGDDEENPTLAHAIRLHTEAVLPLSTAIRKVNGRAQQWVLTPREIMDTLADAMGAPLGSRLTLRSGGPQSKSYKYGVTGTRVGFTRVEGGWRLDFVERTTVWPMQDYLEKLTLPVASAA